ncbi:MAG: HD domain-containing protein [Draconibacterium sp.]
MTKEDLQKQIEFIKKIDLCKVIKMVLIHDIVEIDAGDTFIYDENKNHENTAEELRSAKHTSNNGGTWKEFGVKYETVYEKKKAIRNGSKELWEFAEDLLNDSVKKGILLK